jgi:hypothetical protein
VRAWHGNPELLEQRLEVFLGRLLAVKADGIV